MPRRRLFALLASAGMLAALAATPEAVGAAGGGDSASGNVNFVSSQVDFSAKSTNTGTNASGRIRYTNTSTDPNLVYTADVVCLEVTGATATTPASAVVVGRITSQPAGQTAESIIVNATDWGKFAQQPDGLFAFPSSAPAPPQDTCPAPFGFVNLVADGRVTIENTLP